jgi:hypothetical protein
MDQAEAKLYNLDFKDVMALESSGMDIQTTKKLIFGIVNAH